MFTFLMRKGGIMSDFYSYRDPQKPGQQQYMDYDTGTGAGWIWAIVVLVALVALVAIGMSGGAVEEETVTPATPAAPVAEN